MGVSDNNKGRWYFKKGNKVHGPFPNKLISRYLILGRIQLDTAVSQDQDHWSAVTEYPALVPDIVRHADSEAGKTILMLARIREDERSSRGDEAGNGGGDESKDDNSPPNQHPERRDNEHQMIQRRRQLRDDILKHYRSRPRLNSRIMVASVMLVAMVLAVFFIYKTPSNQSTVDCSSQPQSGVDWSLCNKQGQSLAGLDLSHSIFRSSQFNGADFSRSRLHDSDFSYADLSLTDLQQAQLQRSRFVGANLHRANLSASDLSGADFSYAELTGARLDGANMNNARFDHALWLNGEKCLPGSVSACLVSQ